MLQDSYKHRLDDRVNDLRELLREDEKTTRWTEYLEAIGEPDFEVALPSAEVLPLVLVQLAVPHEDINTLVAMLPDHERMPEIWWLLERCTYSLVREMGAVDGPPPFPLLPEGMGVLHRYFFIYVFVATLPHVRAFHRARGIPEDISRLTLADLGRNMAVHRKKHGVGGLDVPFWLMLHFRGAIYQLGRLQFQRATLGNRTGEAVRAAGEPYGPGDPCLGVHIPDFYGPLSPHACDASFKQAKEFFARYFPDERYDIATCHSWLLDEQLAEYLPEDSSIIRFQRRFRLAYRSQDDEDQTIVRFVFGRTNFEMDELPRRTRLERAIVDHMKAGHHWHSVAGWLRL